MENQHSYMRLRLLYKLLECQSNIKEKLTHITHHRENHPQRALCRMTSLKNSWKPRARAWRHYKNLKILYTPIIKSLLIIPLKKRRRKRVYRTAREPSAPKEKRCTHPPSIRPVPLFRESQTKTQIRERTQPAAIIPSSHRGPRACIPGARTSLWIIAPCACSEKEILARALHKSPPGKNVTQRVERGPGERERCRKLDRGPGSLSPRATTRVYFLIIERDALCVTVECTVRGRRWGFSRTR